VNPAQHPGDLAETAVRNGKRAPSSSLFAIEGAVDNFPHDMRPQDKIIEFCLQALKQPDCGADQLIGQGSQQISRGIALPVPLSSSISIK
jgi:hypothetical protein